MHVDRLNRIWQPTRLANVVNRLILNTTERTKGFPSKASKVLLAWKRTGNLVEIRCKTTSAVMANDYLEIRFSRAEIFTMASRFLDLMPGEELLRQIEKHARPTSPSVGTPQ